MEYLERRCIATSKTTGERCHRAPILGGTVCSMHGGKSPLAKQAAQQRLLAMVEPALDVLLRALQSGNPCTVCGRSDDMALVIRAAQMVLDRTGFGPHTTLTVTNPRSEFDSMSKQELAERAEQLSRYLRTELATAPKVIEGESEVVQSEQVRPSPVDPLRAHPTKGDE
jgi:hypothetical protein